MKKRHNEEQIIRILREAELHAVPIPDLCKQHNYLGADLLSLAGQVRRDGGG